MANRLVPKESARTAAEAEFFVKSETGGAVIPTGNTRPVEGGFAVDCFSTDGYSGPPDGRDGRVCFTVLGVRGEAVDLTDRTKFRFTVSRTSLGLGLVNAGMIISGRIKAGTQFEIEDAFVENAPSDFSERKQFENASQDIVGWTPGVATGAGFSKQ